MLGLQNEREWQTFCAKVLLQPGLPAEFAPRMDPVPSLGEHTESVLAELNYGAGRIARLCEEGAI